GELMSADMAAVAVGMGAVGMTVEKPAELGPALEAALASGRPTVLDVHVDSTTSAPATGSWDLPPLPGPMPNYGW
ncbi:MAG: thiamine pyrophosphate-dependent enzyme, partial [Sciscionella sp.]